LPTNLPGPFATWERARTKQRRQLVAEIQQVAAAVESANTRDPHQEYVTVRMQRAETTRYEAQLHLDPNGSED
jgi:hypothetical protein